MSQSHDAFVHARLATWQRRINDTVTALSVPQTGNASPGLVPVLEQLVAVYNVSTGLVADLRQSADSSLATTGPGRAYLVQLAAALAHSNRAASHLSTVVTGLADLHRAASQPGAADRAESRLDVALGHAAALRSLRRAHRALTRGSGDAQQPSAFPVADGGRAAPPGRRHQPNEDLAHGYLLAALAPQEFADSYDDPYAPPGSVPLPHAGTAATAITDTYPPPTDKPLHERRLDAAVTALDRLLDEYNTVAAIQDRGLTGDGTALAGGARAEVNRAFVERAWHAFRAVLTHAPSLFHQCRAAVADGSADAAIVAQLNEALAPSQTALDAWRHSNFPASVQPAARVQPPKEIRVRLGLAAVPAIETWLTERDVFARSHVRPNPPAHRALPGASPAPPAHPAVRCLPKPPAPRR
ncbi:hypothetical protein [Streptomyces sp. SP17KL33]|uniref:hypothetical protein n=1 Tax=Streptomyces sp. SP17KL33 TaxID=3002534 RepID=UPI002E794A66|nr:hypothetical protein [Streptomyces sp. SP17KL33]MEE1838052.1 hypothetical protein [Streptomyces sp. SP17KL33]